MRLVSEDILHFEDKLYLFSCDLNLLYSIDIETGTYNLIGSIPQKNFFENKLVSSIVQWNRSIYLIPLQEGNVWSYSIDTGDWSEIEIKSFNYIGKNTYFRNAVVYNDKLFAFGGYYPAIVKIDLRTLNVEYDYVSFNYKENKKHDVFFRAVPVQKEDIIYLPSANDNYILKYSLSSGEYEWIKFGKNGDTFSGIECDGEDYWLSPRQNNKDIIKISNNKEIRYSLPKELDNKNSIYIGMCKTNDGYVIPSRYGDNGTIVLKSNDNYEITDNYFMYFKKKNGEIFSQNKDGHIVYIDINGNNKEYSGNISIYDISNTRNNSVRIDRNICKEKILENESINLYDLITITRNGG